MSHRDPRSLRIVDNQPDELLEHATHVITQHDQYLERLIHTTRRHVELHGPNDPIGVAQLAHHLLTDGEHLPRTVLAELLALAIRKLAAQ